MNNFLMPTGQQSFFLNSGVLLLLQSFEKLVAACNIHPCIENTLSVRASFVPMLLKQSSLES
jgi:hypothetical protein